MTPELAEAGYVICPFCRGAVGTTKATFSLREAGIRAGKTLMIKRHRPGGRRAQGRKTEICGGGNRPVA